MELQTQNDIGTWVQQKRNEKELSQAEVARLLRVSQGTVSNWERGKAIPDEVQIESLKGIFGERSSMPDPDVEGFEGPPPSADGWGGQYPLDAVFVRTDARTVVEIVRRIRNGRYDLNPDFQRAFVWDPVKQSRLIESCLMRIPLPVLYVAEALDGRIIVVDGLQRLSTFRRYLDSEFKLTFPKSEDGTAHPLEGKLFQDLETKLQERIEDTSLTLYILDSKAPERAKLDIFERVNSGVPLTRQQMRNCLYNGAATRWLKLAAENPRFLQATGQSLDAQKMRDREAINRYCAFSLIGWQKYKSSDMDSFLADALDTMNRSPQTGLDELARRFDVAMVLNYELFGEHAFRKSLVGPPEGNRSVLNIAFFDVCSVLFSQADPAKVRSNASGVRQALRRLIEDKVFENAITYSTNSRRQVEIRFSMMTAALQEVLK